MSHPLEKTLVQERKSGRSYRDIGEQYGLKALAVRYIVHCAVRRGDVTIQEIGGYRRSEKKRPRMPDDKYNARWLERLARRSYPGPNDCILVNCFHNADGYALLYHRDLGDFAHRIVVILKGRPIPKGMMACHRCGNHGCVNDDHLYVGTMKQNARDTVNHGRHLEANKTHCKHGHAFTPENTRITKTGKRQCRACLMRVHASESYRAWRNEYQKQYRLRRRELYRQRKEAAA